MSDDDKTITMRRGEIKAWCREREQDRARIAELEKREALWREYVEWLTQHAKLPAGVTGDGSRGAELRRRLGL